MYEGVDSGKLSTKKVGKKENPKVYEFKLKDS
jgi:hypothetical protein